MRRLLIIIRNHIPQSGTVRALLNREQHSIFFFFLFSLLLLIRVLEVKYILSTFRCDFIFIPGRYSLNTYLSLPYLDTCIPIHQVGRPHPDSATRVYKEKPKKKSLGVLFRNSQYFRAHTATQLLPLPPPPMFLGADPG